MGLRRTTKPSIRRRHHRRRSRRLTPPSHSLTKTPTENSKSYDEQSATSYFPSVRNPSSSYSAYPDPQHSPAYACNNSPYGAQGYIPIAPLPIFSGKLDECPFVHLFRFDCVCRVNNAVSPAFAADIFPASLDSYAGIWYDIFIDTSQGWDDIRSAFLSAFRPPDFGNRCFTELVSLCQSDNETVSRYHVRMLWILKKWPEHGMSEDILKGIFLDGLREELKHRVAPQRPETLDEAVMLAASWEQAVGMREAQRKFLKIVKCDFCKVEGHEVSGCEMRQRMRALWGSKGSGSLMRREEEGESVRENGKALRGLKRLDSKQSSVQCQCQRHQCWKKMEE